ncbi:TrmH family RNA methyltransferase [Simkania sp.]|uniref:TrmH family RNA methyltransferase n=1 Tax=Simkania sp. TaxID=34094 RepID=UPI003B528243
MDITSLQHPYVKHLVKLRSNRKYRYEKKAVFLEGKKLLSELKLPLKTLIIREGEETSLQAETIYHVPSNVFEKVSGVQAPEGLAAEIAMPPFADLSQKKRVLALDKINDPGNLGTLIRTALALGFDGVFLTENSVDPYNEKALRAAKGATFKIPLQMGDLETFARSFHLYIADLEGTPLPSVTFQTPAILLLGNEAQGISKEMQKNGTSVTIPIKNQMESLNVAIAGSILMHAML